LSRIASDGNIGFLARSLAMQPRQLSRFAAAVLCLSVATTPVLAHHGWAGQQDEQSEVSGKVTKPVNLSGPHATMQITTDAGQVWDITLAPSSRTESAGLTAKTLSVGDAVTVHGNRSSDPKRFEMKTVRVTSGARNYDVYPDRIK
jgi:Family of unknown function (DUF6152)